MIKRKKTRRVISAIAAAFILLSSTVYVPGDYLQEDRTSRAATAEEGEAASSKTGADEGSSGQDTSVDEGSEDMSSGDVTMDELNFSDADAVDPTSRASGSETDEESSDVDSADAESLDEDAEAEEEEEEVKETRIIRRPTVDVVTPDKMKTGDLIKKNTFINMSGYDQYTLVIDECVIEEYEELDEEHIEEIEEEISVESDEESDADSEEAPDAKSDEESEGDPDAESDEESDEDPDAESDEEYLGFLLPDNALVVEPAKSEPDTIYLETIYKGKKVLTETSLRTLLSMGEDVTLGGDIALKESLVINDGAAHTIDLNGNDIFIDKEIGGKKRVITIKNRSKLILKDSGKGDPGEIRGGSDWWYGGGIYVEGSSTLEMTGGAIVKNTANEGAGLYVADGCSARLSGVLVSLNNDGKKIDNFCYGGGIYVDLGAQCKLTDCTIESNSSYNGGGIRNQGNLQMTDTTVSANNAFYGGGIFSVGDAVIENSVITSNKAERDGGGICNCNNMVMTDTEVSANTAGECGGGIYSDYWYKSGKTICSGRSRIIQNNSTFGGGVFIGAGYASAGDYINPASGQDTYPHRRYIDPTYTHGDYKDSFSGCEISHNYVAQKGGGVFIEGNHPEIKFDGTMMEDNYAARRGGGIYTESPISITDSSIRQNTSGDRGGAIYLDYYGYDSDANITITNSTVSENAAYDGYCAGIWAVQGPKTNFILGGGKTVIANNGTVDGTSAITEADKSSIGFRYFKKIKIKGTFKEGSLISVAYDEVSDKKVVTEGYYEYNDKPIDTYFEYVGSNYYIDPNDKLGEVTLKKKLLPTANGYTVRVEIKVTEDADDWAHAYVHFFGKKENGAGDEVHVHSTGDMKSSIDHPGGSWSGEVYYGDTFPSTINVFVDFGGGLIKRCWQADVKVKVNDQDCASSHINILLWGNTVKKGKSDNFIKIGGDKYPNPENVELIKKREIDLLNEASKEVELNCVDQYGVRFQPPLTSQVGVHEPVYDPVTHILYDYKHYWKTVDNIKMENVSFPGEDTFQCINTNNGCKWKFNTTKRDECHNSVYLMKVRSGSSLYPWIEIRIPVRFKVPLRLNVMMMNEDGETYSNLYTKEGRQNEAFDITGLTLPVGYKIKCVKKEGACDFQNPNGNYKNCKMTFFTQNVTLKFETDQIKYTIKYDRNGDKKTVTGNIRSQSHKYSEFVKIEDNKFKCKSGYKFAGWNTEPDGSGVSYAPGDKVSKLSSVNGASVTLYAQWKDADGNLVTASLFSEGNMGLKVGALLSMALVVIAGVRFSVMKRKAK